MTNLSFIPANEIISNMVNTMAVIFNDSPGHQQNINRYIDEMFRQITISLGNLTKYEVELTLMGGLDFNILSLMVPWYPHHVSSMNALYGETVIRLTTLLFQYGLAVNGQFHFIFSHVQINPPFGSFLIFRRG